MDSKSGNANNNNKYDRNTTGISNSSSTSSDKVSNVDGGSFDRYNTENSNSRESIDGRGVDNNGNSDVKDSSVTSSRGSNGNVKDTANNTTSKYNEYYINIAKKWCQNRYVEPIGITVFGAKRWYWSSTNLPPSVFESLPCGSLDYESEDECYELLGQAIDELREILRD